jgi:hypothetical protein
MVTPSAAAIAAAVKLFSFLSLFMAEVKEEGALAALESTPVKSFLLNTGGPS